MNVDVEKQQRRTAYYFNTYILLNVERKCL